MPMFPDLQEDWRTHGGDLARQGLWALAVYRFGTWRKGIRNRLLRASMSFVYRLLKVLAEVLTGADLSCDANLGRRLLIEHAAGIVVSAGTEFGDDCVIRQGVNCGPRSGVPGAPRVGRRVDVGAGAKLLGPITIGDEASIGANAVVIRDVPAGAIAVGVPATVKLRRPPENLVEAAVSEPLEAMPARAENAEDHEDEGVLVG